MLNGEQWQRMLEAPSPRIRTSRIHTNPIKSVNRLKVVNVVTFSCICVDWGMASWKGRLEHILPHGETFCLFFWEAFLKAATSNGPPPPPYLTHSGPGSPRMKGVCLHTKQGQLPDQWPCCNKDPSSYASSETGVLTHVSQSARWLGSLWITSLQAQVWWPSRLFCSKDFSQFHSFLRFNLGKS